MREFTHIHVSLSRTKSHDNKLKAMTIKYLVKMLVVNLSELKYIRNEKTNYGKIIGWAKAQRATLLRGAWQDLPVIITSCNSHVKSIQQLADNLNFQGLFFYALFSNKV